MRNASDWSRLLTPTMSSFALSPSSRNRLAGAGLAAWANRVVAKEKQRIENALTYLHKICSELEDAGCAVTVMKSLDHWPDLGNDLDLYTTADERRVCDVM